MSELGVGVATALWLGILTSMSPCPLATNVAAISFLSKTITSPVMVFMCGVAYTAGRMIAYALVGLIIINSLLSIPDVAQFLQKYMGKIIGPLLIVSGLVLLKIIRIRLPGLSLSNATQNKFAQSGAWGALGFGFIFALAFCPVSAALFFGTLIPLALNSQFGLMLPFVYGVGTGLPVLVFAFVLALGVTSLSCWFQAIARVEKYMRTITGLIFIVVGLYYTAQYIVGM